MYLTDAYRRGRAHGHRDCSSGSGERYLAERRLENLRAKALTGRNQISGRSPPLFWPASRANQ